MEKQLLYLLDFDLSVNESDIVQRESDPDPYPGFFESARLMRLFSAIRLRALLVAILLRAFRTFISRQPRRDRGSYHSDFGRTARDRRVGRSKGPNRLARGCHVYPPRHGPILVLFLSRIGHVNSHSDPYWISRDAC